MKTVVHLSDLHFGRVDTGTLAPLRAAIAGAKPNVVAISGDLTQRARKVEFQQARAFLDSLPCPQIVVPGNHDVPLYGRLIPNPLRNYKRFITEDLEPRYADETISVVGVNTARAFALKSGRISHKQIETVRLSFCDAPPDSCKILVVHHPLDVPSHWTNVPEATRSQLAFEAWFECGVDVILAGHEHRAVATNEATQLRLGKHSAIIVQAGTATSTRVRGEPNSFNLIHIDKDVVVIERKSWSGTEFATTHEDRFSRDALWD